MTSTPNFNQFDNAALVQVYANNSLVTTSCYINATNVPPLVSDYQPVDDSAFAGKETDRYILYNGQQYRNYQVLGTPNSIKEG